MFLIYISGIDGCGKTTQAQLLKEFLKEKKIDVQYAWLRWDPSIRKVFSSFSSTLSITKKKKILSEKGLEMMQHTKWVSIKTKIISFSCISWLWWNYACFDYYFSLRKSLRELSSEVIIVDRYIYDFIIDQASNLKISPDDQNSLLKNKIIKKFKLPNLSIIIHLPAKEGYKRKLNGTSLDYLKEREQRYRSIPHSENILHLDGLKNIDLLAKEIAIWMTGKLDIQD